MSSVPPYNHTSPSENSSESHSMMACASSSHAHLREDNLVPHPAQKLSSSGPVAEDFSTNAPATPPIAYTPRLMDYRQPPSSSFAPRSPLLLGIQGKENSCLVGDGSVEGLQIMSDSVRSGPYDGEDTERSRVRSRTLRVNTIHQRVYHSDELSPLPYPPEISSSHSNSSADSYAKDSLPHPTPHSPSKKRFLLRRPRSVVYLERLLPGFFPRLLSLPDSPLVWLALYFTLNLSLTLYNKSVLIHFPFPYTLTALHALCGTIGTSVVFRLNPGHVNIGARTPTSAPPLHEATPNLNGKQLVVLFLFSILYTVNIVVSNASLRLVTVPFHQVVRASAPFFTIMFAALLLGRRSTKQKLLSLVPVVAGVGFATYGDYYFTPFGFFVTLLGTLLASLKTIITNVILVKPPASGLPVSSDSIISEHVQNQSSFPPSFFSSLATLVINHVFPPSPSSSPSYPVKNLSNQSPIKLKLSLTLPKLCLSPLHLLYLLSPLAFIQTTLLAHFTGELDRVRWHLLGPGSLGENSAPNTRVWLLLNGVLAFLLNVVSFNANRRVGPLGMSVAANVKQVLTILCAVVIFDLTITPANAVGIALTLIGGALYAAVEFREKQETKIRVV